MTAVRDRWEPAVSWLGRHHWAAAAAAYLAAMVVVTWPVGRDLGTVTYGGPGDGWALIWQTRERFEVGPAFFSATSYPDIAWPFGTSFPSGILLSNVVTELPNLLLLAVGLGDVAAYNLIMFAAGVGSAMTMYLALRRLGVAALAAFWGGLVFLIAPWELDRLAIHLTLATLVALPLVFLGVVEWIRVPGPRAGAILVAGVALATYTHVYYALAAGLVLLVCAPLAAIVAARRRELPRMARRTALLVGAGVVVVLPLAVALLVQSGEVTRQLARPLYLSDLALRPHLLALPSVDNPVFGERVEGWFTARALVPNTGELALYLGWVTVALALVAVVGAVRGRVSRLAVVVASLWTATGLVLSLPAAVDLPVVGRTHMPVHYLQELTSFISTPARFFVLTLVGMVVLASLGLASLRDSVTPRAWLGLVAAALVLSAVELTVDPGARVVDAATPPPIVREIMARVPEGDAVMQYPSVDRSQRPIADQLYWQLRHGRPLVNGAATGSFEDAVRQEVADPREPGAARLLALLGVGWVTVDPGAFTYIGGWRDEFMPSRGLRIVRGVEDGTRILRVTAPAADGIVVRYDGFSIEGPSRGSRWMQEREGAVLVCAAAAGEHVMRFRSTAFAQDRTVRIGPATVTVPVGGAEQVISTRIRLRAGWQRLPVTLVGSEPARPSDLIPGSEDTRPLSISMAPPRLEHAGGGDPSACRTRPPDDLLRR